MKNEYDLRISFIRFLAMNLIIICHIMQYNQCELAWWFNVGVQIFLFMSGYLYSKKNIKSPLKFYKKNISKIMIPYYVTIVPIIIIYIFVMKESFSLIYYFKIFLTLGFLPGGDHLWFIQYILFCYLITPIYKKIDNCGNTKCINCILIIIFLIIIEKFRTSAWIFCYLIGLVLGSKNIKPLFVYIICLFMNLIQIYIDYFSNVDMDGLIVKFYDIFCNYAHVFLGITIFYLIINFLDKNKNIIKIKFISWIIKKSDNYSYNIFLVHQFLILGPLSLMTITNNKIINLIIIYIAITTLGIINYYISNIFFKKINKGE